MKISLSNFTFPQKDKMADFFVNFAVAWFVAATIGPFFASAELTLPDFFRTLMGVSLGVILVVLSLFIVKGGTNVSSKY